MVLFRRLLGDVLRAQRMRRGMTLREVSAEARVSLGYISEIERGQKEASSELLASLCAALDLPLSDVLREVSDVVALEEAAGRGADGLRGRRLRRLAGAPHGVPVAGWQRRAPVRRALPPDRPLHRPRPTGVPQRRQGDRSRR